MQEESEAIAKGIKEVGIVEVINDAQAVYERVENPFRLCFFFRRFYKMLFKYLLLFVNIISLVWETK